MQYIPFAQISTEVFTFKPILDGVTYVATCTWNPSSERFYLNIYTTNRTLVLSRPIIGSPDGSDIDLLFGYFESSTMVYRVSSNLFEIAP